MNKKSAQRRGTTGTKPKATKAARADLAPTTTQAKAVTGGYVIKLVDKMTPK